MSTRSYRTWRDRLTEPIWGEGWIRQWRHAIWPISYAGDINAAGGHAIRIDLHEAHDLVERFERRAAAGTAPLVTEEQAEKGRQWLARYARRLGVEGPLPNVGPPLELPDFNGIDHFRFVDVAIYRETQWRIDTMSVYRAVWPDGLTFTYNAAAWQSGRDRGLDYTWKVSCPAS